MLAIIKTRRGTKHNVVAFTMTMDSLIFTFLLNIFLEMYNLSNRLLIAALQCMLCHFLGFLIHFSHCTEHMYLYS